MVPQVTPTLGTVLAGERRTIRYSWTFPGAFTALVAFACSGQVEDPGASGALPSSSAGPDIGGVGSPSGQDVGATASPPGPDIGVMPTPASGTGAETDTGAGDDSSEPAAVAPPSDEWPSAGLRRLNADEYRATVRDLFGVDVLASHALQADTQVAGFTSIGAATVSYSAQQIEQFEQAAYDATREIWADTARRAELVGCDPASPEDACVNDFLSRFTSRAFRRPATAGELDAYAGLVASVALESDVWSGLAYAVAAILQSPSFLYRSELGEAEAEMADHRRLTAFELATRLSYLVTGSTPDDTLLEAAETGVLDSQEGLLGELDRLLAFPDAEATLMKYLEQQLDLDPVSNVIKLEATFPTFSPELAGAMHREMHEVVREVALRSPDDLLSLLTRRDTYVNGPLAELYGLPEPTAEDDWRTVTLPSEGPRAGLLGFAGFLALHAGPAETSVTKRGLFVTSKLLCRTIPAPPPDLEAQLADVPEGEHRTMRERVEQHMSDPACSTCHAVMDPPGLALEHFDALGVYRETDNGLAIDASGEVDGQPFNDAVELASLLANHPDVSACFARRFYEFAFGTQISTDAQVSELVGAFEQSGRRLPELLRSLVAHDVFRFVSAPR